MASIPSQEPPMPEPHGLDHCSTSPSKTLAQNPENPSDVEEETSLEPNSESEIKTEMKTEDKSLKSRGRPKKKEKQKQPVSETRNKPKLETENRYDRPIYASPFQDETRNVFVPSDLVWGKVKSHPWWPGQIFDPSDASELALKHRNRNNFLVAYFGDNTFAWNEASVLKPFQSNFSRMMKQSSTDAFMSAVETALAEVSWRVGSALSCGCYSVGESSAKVKIENAGIRADTDTGSQSGDALFVRRSFDPVKFLGFLCELGQNPHGGFESLDVVVAKSQLKAFNQSRGCNFDLPEFSFTCAFEEDAISLVNSDRIYTKKPNSIDSRSCDKLVIGKYVPEEEGRKKKKLSEIFNKIQILRTPHTGCKVRVGGPTGSDNSEKIKKKRLDLLGDFGTKLKARRKYLRVGQCMRRAANQTMHTIPNLKPNGMTSRKRKSLSMIIDRINKEPLQKKKQKVYSDNLWSKSSRKKKEVLRENEDDEGSFSLEDYSSSSEMLSQLCLAARDPLKGYSFIIMIDRFFTRFRDYAVNTSAGKRNGGRSTSKKSSLVDDKLEDSYTSDPVVHDNDEEKLSVLRQKKQRNGKGEKEKNFEGKSAVSDVNTSKDLGNENKQEGNLGISDANEYEPVSEVEESMPTALVLTFKEAAPLPTGPELNGLFARFGPLKEAETEVSEKEGSAQVVFERHADAEVALSNAGSLDAFRPDLVSFQLSCAPTSSNVELSTSQVEVQGEKDAAPPVKAAW